MFLRNACHCFFSCCYNFSSVLWYLTDGNFQVWKIGHYYFFIPCFCFQFLLLCTVLGVLCRLGLLSESRSQLFTKAADGSHCCSPQDLCFCQQCCVFSNKALIRKQNWFFALLPPSLPSEAWALCHFCCGLCFSVNCLYPWVCSHALPDVLAARLHSRPAPTSPGLLLVRPFLCVWLSHSTGHMSWTESEALSWCSCSWGSSWIKPAVSEGLETKLCSFKGSLLLCSWFKCCVCLWGGAGI